jgi:hypothetical protein
MTPPSNDPSPRPSPSQGWLADLFEAAGVPVDADLPTIAAKMDALADAAAPVARGWWKWMLLVQGVSALCPILWLVREPYEIAPLWPASLVLIATLLSLAALWWMRWRGMQRTWARARLVGEIARGQLAARSASVAIHPHGLDAVPALDSIFKRDTAPTAPPWPVWRDAWIAARIDDQLGFYRRAREKAERERTLVSRWITRILDVTLALAVAAFIVAASDRGAQWLRQLGAYSLEVGLGVLGIMGAVFVIQLQAYRSVAELNRRGARFARQERMLTKAKEDLLACSDAAEARAIAEATENQLLGEVLDWFFETETAEQFFQVRAAKDSGAVRPARADARPSRIVGWAAIVWGVSFAVFLRVLLGRAPWVLGASAVTLAWISYTAVLDPVSRSRLKLDAHLVGEDGQAWVPRSDRAKHGCIIIAHGLHDGVMKADDQRETRWMADLAKALRNRLGDRTPNIGLVDWETAANPLRTHGLDPRIDGAKFFGDVAGIKTQGLEVGDYLALRLMQYVRDGVIARDQPLHLIGHSAGGFVCARAATLLREMGFAPSEMHVTILDTPAPDSAMLQGLARSCPTDYYVTSGFVRGMDPADPPAGIHVYVPSDGKDRTWLEAHSYAYLWFTETVTRAAAGDEGFGRSPFARRLPK